MLSGEWTTKGELDVVRTLRFALPRTPSLFRFDDGAVSYGLHTPEGAAAVRVRSGDGVVRAEATGPGAETALATVPRALGLDDDPNRFAAGSGLMRDLHRRFIGFRLGSNGRVFDSMLPTLIEQRVTTAESGRSYERLVRRTGEPAPGDWGVLLPPTPAAVLALSSGDFHTLGIDQARARTIREVARRAGRLEETIVMSRVEARHRLEAVRGVGPWTSGQVMGAAWGDRDAIPTGDFHLPNTVAWALAKEPRADDERMLELLEPYRPQRRRALLLVKISGIHAPRYGPRSGPSIISRGGAY